MRGEGSFGVFRGGFGGVGGFGLDLVKADGGFEHEEDVEALLADVSDDPGDVFRLGDGLVDGLAEFLDQVFDFLVQCQPPGAFC